MTYVSKPMRRRDFLWKAPVAAAGIGLGLAGASKLYADDRIEDEKIIEKFNRIYGKVKGRSGEFEEMIDINGDGTMDKVKFKFSDSGSVLIDKEPASGKVRLDLDFESGDTWLGRVYAAFEGDKVKYYKDGKPLCKSQWVKKEKLEEYLEAVLKHYEK